MPKLPTAQQLGARIPQDRSNVVTGNFDTSGFQQLGQTVEAFGAGIKDRQDAMNLQKAKTHWSKAKLAADNAFDQDNDFETYVERYNEALGKAEEQAGEMITNSRMKEIFKDDISLSRAQGVESMKDFAFSKETESGLATLQQILDDNREIALNATTNADRESAFDTMNDAIGTAELVGYVDADNAQIMRKKVGTDAAIGTIQVQDLKTQQQMLANNEGPAELIPTDVRKSMLENVNNRLVNQEGMIKADEIRAQGGDLTERLDSVRKIKDPDIRKAAQIQVEHDYAMERTAKGELFSENYSDARKALNAGSSIGEWIQQNPEQWDGMTGDQQAQLLTGGKQTTDFALYHNLNMMLADSPKEAYQTFLKEGHRLAPAEFKELSKRFAGASEEPEPIDSLRSEFNTWAKRFNLSEEDNGLADQRLKREYELWVRANPGKELGFKDQQEIMSSVYDWSANTFFGFKTGGKTFRFELPPVEADRKKLEDKATEYEEIYGEPPDDQTMIRIRDKMIRDGLIPEYE